MYNGTSAGSLTEARQGARKFLCYNTIMSHSLNIGQQKESSVVSVKHLFDQPFLRTQPFLCYDTMLQYHEPCTSPI